MFDSSRRRMLGWTGSQLDARPESADALPDLAYHQSTKHFKALRLSAKQLSTEHRALEGLGISPKILKVALKP